MAAFDQVFEFVPSNGTFKYKFKNRMIGNMAVTVESEEIPVLKNVFQQLAEISDRIFNCEYRIVRVFGDDLRENNSMLTYQEDVYLIVFPFSLDSFHNEKHYFPSPLFRMSDVLLLSKPPKATEKYTFSIFNFDPVVTGSLVISILIISFISHLSERINCQRKKKNKSLPQFWLRYFKYLWDTFFLLFLEPIMKEPSFLSGRINIGAWFVALLIVLSVLSCELNTNAYETQFDTLDSMDDWRYKSKLKLSVQISSDAQLIAEKYVKEKEDSLISSRIKLEEFFATGLDSFYKDISKGVSAYLVHDHILDFTFEFVKDFMKDKPYPQIYFSKEVIERNMHVFAIANIVKNTPEIIEILALLFEVMSKTRCLDYLFFTTSYNKALYMWSPPVQTIRAINIKETYPTLDLFLKGMSWAGIVLAIELIIFHGRKLRKNYYNHRKRCASF